MKIVGGQNRGRRLKVSKKGIRPTKSIVREAIFSIIGEKIDGAEVLDIFAGSGALGLEAISRGARSCVFIEKNPKMLLQNISNLDLTDKTRVIKGDFRTGLRKIKGKIFDIIFLDPPYRKNYVGKTIELISLYDFIGDRSIVVAEHCPEEKFVLAEGLSKVKIRRYGETVVSFISANDNEV